MMLSTTYVGMLIGGLNIIRPNRRSFGLKPLRSKSIPGVSGPSGLLPHSRTPVFLSTFERNLLALALDEAIEPSTRSQNPKFACFAFCAPLKMNCGQRI